MYLVQLFLPLENSQNQPIPTNVFTDLSKELTELFGGLTTYTRSPAKGLWKEPEGKTDHDNLVIYEVITEQINREWWKKRKALLEKIFDQDTIHMRASMIELL